MAQHSTPSPSRRRAAPPPAWVGSVASAFVLLALAALVIGPLLLQRYVAERRERVEEVADPARTLVRRVQLDLAREATALLLVSTTGAPEAAEAFREARLDEQAQLPQLRIYAEKLGGEVLRDFRRFDAAAAQWRAQVAFPAPGEEPASVRAALATARAELRAVDQALAAGNRLDAALVREARRSRDAVRRTERFALRVMVGLGIMALLAATSVAWLSARVRQLATVATLRSEEAERALAETARATEARSHLLRGVSHDVKNPLGAARGYAELLQAGVRGELTPEQAAFVDGIRRSIDGALAILADLLDVARADSGGLHVERVPAELGSIASEAAEDHRAAARAAGHALECPPPPRPIPVHTDPARVRQVLGNLLSNAVKYTPPPGRITVRAEQADGGARRPGTWAVVHVTDTGPGIPPEHRETIFDEFTRLHDATQIQGHGLGLAISRRVARLLGGDLDVAGEPGEGA
ncbi:MAG: HAMP domain-containing histidine kinase, partial [Gemmatimonadetes bacterium]|nr:HAMP domain-containing histidine kinase [Gemmatimonadota bacterium]